MPRFPRPIRPSLAFEAGAAPSTIPCERAHPAAAEQPRNRRRFRRIGGMMRLARPGPVKTGPGPAHLIPDPIPTAISAGTSSPSPAACSGPSRSDGLSSRSRLDPRRRGRPGILRPGRKPDEACREDASDPEAEQHPGKPGDRLSADQQQAPRAGRHPPGEDQPIAEPASEPGGESRSAPDQNRFDEVGRLRLPGRQAPDRCRSRPWNDWWGPSGSFRVASGSFSGGMVRPSLGRQPSRSLPRMGPGRGRPDHHPDRPSGCRGK